MQNNSQRARHDTSAEWIKACDRHIQWTVTKPAHAGAWNLEGVALAGIRLFGRHVLQALRCMRYLDTQIHRSLNCGYHTGDPLIIA